MTVCRKWCLLVLMLVSLVAAVQAQQVAGQYAFRIGFNDKAGSANIGNPLSFLSQRALDRRSKFHIAVDTTDLPVSPDYVDSVLRITAGKLHVTSRWLNQCVVLVHDSSKILLLQNKPFIRSIEVVGAYTPDLHRGAQNKFAQEASLMLAGNLRTTGNNAAYYGNAYPQTTIVHGDTLHDLDYTGKGIMVAVLDAGFQGTDTHHGFDSLRQHNAILGTHDFVLAGDSVYGFEDHGTRVLSAIAGNMPNSFVGAAPDVKVVLYRTEDNTQFIDQAIEMDNLIAGTERADSLGVDITHASLGYNSFFFPQSASITPEQMDGKSTMVARAVNLAGKKGMMFVCTSGNEGVGSSGMLHTLLTPGESDSAFTVGMVTVNKIPDGLTSRGPNAANIIKPDVCTLGSPAWMFNGAGGISSSGGTSFAAPQITGWIACLMEAKPNATLYEIKQAIIKSADHYAVPGPQIGYGVPDFRTALYLLGVTDTARTPNTNDLAAVWPNPFNDNNTVKLMLNLSEDQQVQMALFDISGRLCWKSENSYKKGNRQVSTLVFPGRLPGGMYFLKVVGNSKSQTIKLIKS